MDLYTIRLRTLNKLRSFEDDFFLLTTTPKDYLFLYTAPTDKSPEIKPYSMALTKKAASLTKKIGKQFPALEVHLAGSVGLRISGMGDVDLYAICPHQDFSLYRDGLTTLFGKPSKIRSKCIEWSFFYKNSLIELALVDPSYKTYQQQMRVYKILKKNKLYRDEYLKIKLECTHTSIREYRKRRMVFFNKILGL